MRSPSIGRPLRIVAVSDFSGLVSSACALASAAAMVPIVSLDRCMAALHRENIEADRTGFGALGANPVADRLLGIFRHQALQFGLGSFVLEKGIASRPEHGCELGPCIGRAHVDNSHRLDARSRWLDIKEVRGLAALDAAPEFLLSGQQEVLVEWVG